MNTLSRAQGLSNRLLYMLTNLFAYIASVRTCDGERDAETYTDAVKSCGRLDTATPFRAAELFVQALCDDSNHKMDWLWLSRQCVRDHERRYCLQRALHINPESWFTKQELAKLTTTPAYIQHLTGQTA